ncbi:thioredoxin [Cnuella takakiae]|uniref:Thioredoxin n=2 Tax=Cnuella takakiae TaxID=1302690 RepID=A0A1M4Y0Y0_9BACT|nr:thioredoxin [Cnuella takakiae]
MESLQQIINGPLPVLIDFYADWCGPCKAMNPVISQLGKTVQGKARVLKINIDKNQGLAHQLGVQAVPTFIVFNKGQQIWRHAGMVDGRTLEGQLLQVGS